MLLVFLDFLGSEPMWLRLDSIMSQGVAVYQAGNGWDLSVQNPDIHLDASSRSYLIDDIFAMFLEYSSDLSLPVVSRGLFNAIRAAHVINPSRS